MRLRGATPHQEEVIRRAEFDLDRAGVRLPIVLKVAFDPAVCEAEGVLGLWQPDGVGHIVTLSPDLKDGGLYATFLHEIGHALGLDHTKRGIMSSAIAQVPRRLTLRNRRKWLRQLLRYLTNKRLQELR